MVKYKFNCLYCDHYWDKTFYGIPQDDELKCPKCGDSNIRKLKLENENPFGYNLPKKKEKKDAKS